MAKGILVELVLILGWIAGLHAEAPYISGKIHADKNVFGTLLVCYIPDSVVAGKRSEISFKMNINSTGRFSFHLPPSTSLYRARLFFYNEKVMVYLSSLVINPNDSIVMDVFVKPNASTVINYSGRGYEKYRCLQEIEGIRVDQPSNNSDISYWHSVLDSQLAVLKKFSQKIDSSAYQIILANTEGRTLDLALRYSFSSLYLINDASCVSLTLFRQKESLMRSFLRVVANLPQPKKESIEKSISYQEFLFELSKIQTLFLNRGQGVDFETVYDNIKVNYFGVLKEELLFKLFSSLSADTVDRHIFNKCLGDFISFAQVKNIKNDLLKINSLSSRSQAMDFELPMDSSNRKVKLSSLRGKVVLLDGWGGMCSACIQFAKCFHEEIYPEFKNDSSFVVVSINFLESDDSTLYLKKLRGEDKFGKLTKYIYTYKDYINLYAKQERGEKILKFYGTNGYPLLVLIDKAGNIIASSSAGFPIFADRKSGNVKILRDLIRENIAN